MATKGKEWMKTRGDVFDYFTERTLFKLSSQGHFDDPKALSPLKIGKESNVFLAKKDDELIILKIYRLETCDFNRMYDYIKYDPRYQSVSRRRRQVIFSWVQKEFRNLHLARDAEVAVPTPYAYANNVLVMECIGSPTPSLQLKDSHPQDPEHFAQKILEYLKLLFKAGLVHGDLSSFNILNRDESPVFIDFSQSTTLENINAKDYLKRDIKNIAIFFGKYKCHIDKEDWYRQIIKYLPDNYKGDIFK